MLTSEQAKEIKKQILEQIQSWPDEQRQTAQKQIEDMNEEELEQFLIKNKLIKQESEQATTQDSKGCVFCSIINNQIPAYKLDENKQILAILEINPLSKGHSLIIPKKHLPPQKIPNSAFSLAKKIQKKLGKLKPEKIEISTSEFQGHGIINIIPYYKTPPQKYKAEKSELAEVQAKLAKKPKKKTKPIKKELEKIKNLPKFPIRIP